MRQSDLSWAKKAKNDEFYTQYNDIQRELNCYYLYDKNFLRGKTVLCPCDDPEWSNFTKFFALNLNRYGLKKLISTSYAANPNDTMTNIRGKILTLDRDTISHKSLQCEYLNGDGDFRSDEVKALRDEADVIITNPPFSLFREFIKWIIDANKQFLIIGNINCINYKEVFPLIKDNKIWLGNGMGRWISGFIVPEGYELYGTEARIEDGERIVATNQCLWLTNLKHGRRYQPLRLMTMDQNLRHSKHKIIREQGYPKYDNYDAIDVPFTDAIPDDYDGVMGVPISFLNRYCPEQFEILGLLADKRNDNPAFIQGTPTYLDEGHKNYVGAIVNGKATYSRILIRRR